MSLAGKCWRFAISLGAPCFSHGEHVTRYFMYRSLSSMLLPEAGNRVLSIGHSMYLVKILGLAGKDVVEANYPENDAANLHSFHDNEFNYVVSDQVLEHVEACPQKVFDETWRVLKPGGLAIHTTCLINPIHKYPSDYWRFTPDGLKYLARDFSETIAIGGFGNRAIWLLDALGIRYMPIPHAKWHPLHKLATKNNPLWPISIWIVARK
jgi:SAM-dependent methyltransferase